MKFTDRAINALKPASPAKDYLVFDSVTPSLGLRVGANGKKTFLFQARVNGRVFRETIGRYGDRTIESARAEARKKIVRTDGGADLFAERKRAKEQAAEDKHTFAVAIEQWRWAALKAGRRPAYVAHAVSAARRIYADLLDKPVAEITRKQLQGAVDEAEEKRLIDKRIVDGRVKGKRIVGGPAAAVSAALAASAILRRAVKREHIAKNPASGLDLPELRDRKRALDESELRRIWAAAGTLRPPASSFVRFLMLTLVRRSEAAGARFSELSGALWSIPAERMKGGQAHSVTLSDAALDAIASARCYQGSDFIFTHDGRSGISGFNRIKVRLDRALAEDGGPELKSWRLHDFRRSGVSWLASKGVGVEIADKLLAHKRSTKLTSVGDVYQHYDFGSERAKALQMWGAFLSSGAKPAKRKRLELVA